MHSELLGFWGSGVWYVCPPEDLHEDTARPGCTAHLCQALPAGDCDFSASVSVSPSEVSSEVTRRERGISDLESQWAASK